MPNTLVSSRAVAALLTASSLGLAGCSGGLTPTVSTQAISVAGNWQVSSSAAAASKLPVLSGTLSGSNASMTGLFHAGAAASCVSPAAVVELMGSANGQNVVTLTGADFAGGTLTITGTLAADGKSLTGASYGVKGGTCAMAQAAAATMQSYDSIDGTFAGSFSDSDGQLLTMTSQLTQTPSDANGNYQLSGSATLPDNPCFPDAIQISSSQVTGGSFTLTYGDATNGGNSVTASGTFSPDGTTLTVTGWTLSGTCGPDSGTGLLTKQGS